VVDRPANSAGIGWVIILALNDVLGAGVVAAKDFVAQDLRCHGRATALLAALTFNFRLRSRNAVIARITRSPVRWLPT